jgi:hypothetical protein
MLVLFMDGFSSLFTYISIQAFLLYFFPSTCKGNTFTSTSVRCQAKQNVLFIIFIKSLFLFFLCVLIWFSIIRQYLCEILYGPCECAMERDEINRLERGRLLNYFNIIHNMDMKKHMLICFSIFM